MRASSSPIAADSYRNNYSKLPNMPYASPSLHSDCRWPDADGHGNSNLNTFTPAASPGRSPPLEESHKFNGSYRYASTVTITEPLPTTNGSSASRITSPAPEEKLSSVYNLLHSNHTSDPTVTVSLTGHELTISQLQSIMKAGTRVHIDSIAKRRVQASVEALQAHLKAEHCIYGVNTGFGASADSRTKHPDILQAALLQMQHIGIIPCEFLPRRA